MEHGDSQQGNVKGYMRNYDQSSWHCCCRMLMGFSCPSTLVQEEEEEEEEDDNEEAKVEEMRGERKEEER